MVGRGACMVAWGACVVAPGGGMRGCSRGFMCGCSGGGACLVAPGGGMHGCSQGGMCGCSQGACMAAPRGGMHGCLGGHAWDTMRYGDTINEWAVRILLECILVVNHSPQTIEKLEDLHTIKFSIE